MVQLIQPNTFAEIAELCRASRRFLPVGSQSKRALTEEVTTMWTIIEMRGHTGVTTTTPVNS